MYLGSSKDVLLLLPYYLHVEIPYGNMYVHTNWSWNYSNRSTSIMAADHLKYVAYQHLLLFINLISGDSIR